MSSLDEFFGKPKTQTEVEIVRGAFNCDHCNKGSNVATYNVATKVLMFTCVSCNKTTIWEGFNI